MKYFPGASILVGGSDNVLLLADDTVPTLSSAALNAEGNILTLTFSEPIQNPGLGYASTGWSITPDGGAATLTPLSNLGIIDTLRFSISRNIVSTETVTVSYSATTGNTRDNANNVLATITNHAVTNSSIEETAEGNLDLQDGSDLLLQDSTFLSLQ